MSELVVDPSDPKYTGLNPPTFFDIFSIEAPVTKSGAENLEKLILRLDEYLKSFVKPKDDGEGGVLCVGCGHLLYGGYMGLVFGATFRWGIANGEGYCSCCRWPCRRYHRPKEGEFFDHLLQYHPSLLIQKDEQERRTEDAEHSHPD